MRRLLTLLLALCLTLTLAGCEREASADSQPVSPSPIPTPAPASSPGGEPFSLGYDPASTLHPITGTSQVNQDLTGLVYQGLYQLDNHFTPQPVLAKSAQASQDGLVWTIGVKDGVTFSDGTPLTADHVAASLNVARTSGLYGDRLAAVDSVLAGEGIVTITLSSAHGNLPALLDVPVVLDRGTLAPLGTGYYQYESAGTGLALQINPHHPSAAALPYTAIRLVAVSDAEQYIAAFDTGQVSAVTTDFSKSYAIGYTSSFEAKDYPTTNLLYIGFRTTGGPCQSPVVRQAFARAFDREAVTRSVLSGHGQASTLPISPAHREYDGQVASLLDCDMKEAAALLGEAGYALSEEGGMRSNGGRPLTVTLLVNSDGEAKQAVAKQLAASLTDLGVTVEITAMAWEEYAAALAAGRFDLYLGEVRLTGDFDPAVLLTGRLNYGGYTSQTLPDLVSRWRAAQGEERVTAAAKLWEELAQSVPIAPLCFKRGSLLMRWGTAANLQPTRANPFWQMEQWTRG